MITPLILILAGMLVPMGVSAAENLKTPQSPSQPLTDSSKRRNPALAISAESVLEKLTKKQKMILVDVRRREKFEKFNIPGSINIPLFAIKTKPFLKAKPLILVNEGYTYTNLERECERLRKSGFNVWLLNGGLNYWRALGAPLRGDLFSQKALNKISPRDFHAEKDNDSWLMIDVSPSKSTDARSLIPQSIFIPRLKEEKKFILTLKRTLATYRAKPFVSVLIWNEKGEQYDDIEKIVRNANFKNVFYLKGGVDAYRKFLEEQAVSRQAGHEKKLQKCSNCP
jgi:rhodanese-related sulfurtransferase